MSRSARIIAGLVLATACGQVLAQSATFGVSMRVLPEHVATAGPVDLPTPPGAQPLPPSRDAKRLLYGGSPADAMRFYGNALPGLGFFLTRQDALGQVWERADVRAELLFHPVVGEQNVSGIYVTIAPRERSATTAIAHEDPST